MRVLVCGGRTYGRLLNLGYPPDIRRQEQERVDREQRLLFDTLDTMKVDKGISAIITGDAPGADRLAARWARRQMLTVHRFDAEWGALGISAGPRRNQRMLDEGKPDMVVAFAGGRGTADMVSRAKKAGVRVIEVL